MSKTIKYHQVGDHLISNFELPAEEKSIQIGIWGMCRKNYLMNDDRVLFNIMLVDGTLWEHLAEIDKEAEDIFSRLVDEMARAENVSEKLKATDQMAWIGAMNNIRQRAMEIINQELICC